MDIKLIIEIEKAYEQRDEERLRALSSPAAQMFKDFLAGNYAAVYAQVDTQMHLAENPEEKVFWLQWAVAASELSGDMDLRSKWLKHWSEIRGWASSDYCRYLRGYHDGVGAFSQASLSDSERYFRNCLELSLSLQYQRGVMRSLFHLGLVFRDLGRHDESVDYLLHAQSKADALGALAFKERIAGELAAIKDGEKGSSTVPHYIATVEKELRAGDFIAARQALASAERMRRAHGFGRSYHRLITYLIPVSYAFGNKRLAERLLCLVHDPILRIKALTLWNEVEPLESDLQREFEVLREIYGISLHVEQSSLDPLATKICGLRLRDVADESVRKLVLVLLASKTPVSKEEICRSVWGLEYDPVNHDNKIYKLFHKTRKIFKQPKLLSNHYGAYSLSREAFSAGKKVS